jgi:hypothetical protein
LDEYFGYLRIVRVNELKKIAEDFGAKYFKVTFMEEQASFSSNKIAASAKAATIASADAKRDSEKRKYSSVEIKAEMRCPGHSPVEPQLKYWQRDPSIQTLVELRMKERITQDKYMLKLSQSSGMKENDAVKIDAVLKGMKCSGNTTVASEAKNEARRYLEYEIEF